MNNYLVFSNDGGWESDMVGLVGTTPSLDSLISTIKTDLSASGKTGSFHIVSDRDQIQVVIDDNELTILVDDNCRIVEAVVVSITPPIEGSELLVTDGQVFFLVQPAVYGG